MGLFDYLYPVVTRKNDDESKTDKQDRPHRGGRRVCDRPDRPAGDERRGMAKGRTYRPEPADDRFDDHQCGGENLDGDLDPPDRADGRPPGSGCPGADPCRPSADGPQPAGVHPPISPPAGRRIRTMHIAFTRRDCIPLRLSINQYVCEAIPHPHGDATQAIPGHPPAGRLPATLSVGLTRRADCPGALAGYWILPIFAT